MEWIPPEEVEPTGSETGKEPTACRTVKLSSVFDSGRNARESATVHGVDSLAFAF